MEALASRAARESKSGMGLPHSKTLRSRLRPEDKNFIPSVPVGAIDDAV